MAVGTEMLALLNDPRPERVFMRVASVDVSVRTFLADVAAMEAWLPNRKLVINLCRDRYRFIVAFAAALCRGQVSLLPPFDTAGVIEQIASDYPDAYVLHDGHQTNCGVVSLAWPVLKPVHGDPGVPRFPATQQACVLFTSGSTGAPQPYGRSWGELVRSTLAAGRALGVAALPGAALIGTVPHQHSYGLESLVMLALQHGLVLYNDRPFYPHDICTLLDDAGPRRILVTTPVHLRVLLDAEDALPATPLVVSATAPLPQQVARDAEARFAGALREIYGCSEVGQLAQRRPTDGPDWTLLDGVTLRPDGDFMWARAGDGAEARLGDQIALGDGAAFLLLGRQGDMVEIAGKRTSLAHLGFQLNAIHGVRDGVFVLSDEPGSQLVRRLIAFVVAPGLGADAIMASLRLSIDPAFLPRRLHLVEILPRNTVGKLTQQALQRLLTAAEGCQE